MRKIIQLLCIGMILFAISCKKDTGNDINPLVLLGSMGNSRLTITATYTGTTVTGVAPSDGTGKIFVYLYKSLGVTTRDPVPAYTGSTDAPVTSGTPANINITGIVDGDYYMLVFYDYSLGGKHNDNKDDRYVLYTNTPYTSAASKVNISGDVFLTGITFGDLNILADQSVFMTPPGTTYKVSINATYTGTASADALATKRMYVYLYQTSLGTSTTLPSLPVYTGSTTAAVTPNTPYVITVSGVTAGNYYALIFYDSVKGATTDNEGDPYTFFAGTPYTANATQFIVGTADVTLPAVSFGETNTLQTDGVYLTTATTYSLTVNATYTGAEPSSNVGSKKIYVYLYSVLGTGTRNQYLPIYTGSTAAAVTVSTPADITIAGVLPGDYSVLIFYDFRSGTNPDNQTDRFILYNNVGTPASASKLTITGDTTVPGVSFGNTYQLLSGLINFP